MAASAELQGKPSSHNVEASATSNPIELMERDSACVRGARFWYCLVLSRAHRCELQWELVTNACSPPHSARNPRVHATREFEEATCSMRSPPFTGRIES